MLLLVCYAMQRSDIRVVRTITCMLVSDCVIKGLKDSRAPTPALRHWESDDDGILTILYALSKGCTNPSRRTVPRSSTAKQLE